jgi:hypothetical protein
VNRATKSPNPHIRILKLKSEARLLRAARMQLIGALETLDAALNSPARIFSHVGL